MALGGTMLPIAWAGTHWLKSDDPAPISSTLLEYLEKIFDEHLLLHKAQQIEMDLSTQSLQPHHKEELEWLDDLWIQGMLQAECQYHKLHT